MKAANLLIRFLLEICALGALAYSGYHSVSNEAARVALTIAAPLLFAVLCGAFVTAMDGGNAGFAGAITCPPTKRGFLRPGESRRYWDSCSWK